VASFTYDGVSYPLPSEDDMNIDELCRLTDLGATFDENGNISMNGHAIKALLTISMERSGVTVDAKAIGEIKMSEIKWEVPDAVPPPNRAARRANGNGVRKTARDRSGSPS